MSRLRRSENLSGVKVSAGRRTPIEVSGDPLVHRPDKSMHDKTSAAQVRWHRLEEKLKRELGPTVLSALADPSVIEVMLNPDGRLWVDEFGNGMRNTGATMDAAQAESLLGTVAMMLTCVINAEHPLIEAELPIAGSRLTGALPPIVSSPTFAIRKRSSQMFTIDDYVRAGTLTEAHAAALRAALMAHENILIVGSSGSGKTTLATALLNELRAILHPGERIVILEDTVELQCSVENHARLRTTDTIDMTRLLRTTLRLRPDRIVVGEVRGPEALTLLKAWNTGHPGGIATIHANSPSAGLDRLERLIEEAGVRLQPRLIAEAINRIVYATRTRAGFGVSEVVAVHGWNPSSGYLTE